MLRRIMKMRENASVLGTFGTNLSLLQDLNEVGDHWRTWQFES